MTVDVTLFDVPVFDVTPLYLVLDSEVVIVFRKTSMKCGNSQIGKEWEIKKLKLFKYEFTIVVHSSLTFNYYGGVEGI